jgi:hypothetical protein
VQEHHKHNVPVVRDFKKIRCCSFRQDRIPSRWLADQNAIVLAALNFPPCECSDAFKPSEYAYSTGERTKQVLPGDSARIVRVIRSRSHVARPGPKRTRTCDTATKARLEIPRRAWILGALPSYLDMCRTTSYGKARLRRRCCAQQTGVHEMVVEALLVTIYSTWVAS